MSRRKPLTLPSWLARGIARAEKGRRASVIARPMRDLFDVLAQGEVWEIDGQAVMRMPEADAHYAPHAEWCAIAPAMEGWIDCWHRAAPDISTDHLAVLAARLRDDKPITPRLVEKARAEFDATIARIPVMPEGALMAAISTTEIAWEIERLEGATC